MYLGYSQAPGKGEDADFAHSAIMAGCGPLIIEAYRNAGGGKFGEQVAVNFVAGLFAATKEALDTGKIGQDEAIRSANVLRDIVARVSAMRVDDDANKFIRRCGRSYPSQAPSVDACSYCGSTGGEIESDHVVAKSLGGSDDPHNRVPACRSCNSQKSDKPLLIWLMEIGT